MRDCDRLRVVERAIDVVLVDAVAAADADHATAVDRRDVRAGQADERGADLVAGGALRFVDGFGDRAAGLIDVDDHALAHALRRRQADAQDAQSGAAGRGLFHVRHERAHLCGADINPDQKR